MILKLFKHILNHSFVKFYWGVCWCHLKQYFLSNWDYCKLLATLFTRFYYSMWFFQLIWCQHKTKIKNDLKYETLWQIYLSSKTWNLVTRFWYYRLPATIFMQISVRPASFNMVTQNLSRKNTLNVACIGNNRKSKLPTGYI